MQQKNLCAVSVTNKDRLRKQLLKQRNALSPEFVAACSTSIADKLFAEPWFQDSRCIMLYSSVGNEVCTHKIFQKSLEMHKQICFPKCIAQGTMTSHLVKDQSDLQNGKFGILETKAFCPAVRPEQFDLIVVPAVGCDKNGFRIGYGKGYYDRFLPQTSAKKICLVFQDFLIPETYPGKYDCKCQKIITEDGVYEIL